MYEEVSRELVVARTDDVEFEVRMAMTGFLAGSASGVLASVFGAECRQHVALVAVDATMFAARTTLPSTAHRLCAITPASTDRLEVEETGRLRGLL